MLGFRAGRGRDFRGVYMKILVFVRGVWRGFGAGTPGGPCPGSEPLAGVSRFCRHSARDASCGSLTPPTGSVLITPRMFTLTWRVTGVIVIGEGTHDEFALQTDRTWCEKKTFRRRVRIRLGGRPGAPDQSRRPIR